ncbi:MAG: sodium:proton antiporter NhaD [Gammaproteobacteria bacterium]|nr:sodium:proton antiporter NhaD [Gammaproteobacteria bacterium]
MRGIRRVLPPLLLLLPLTGAAEITLPPLSSPLSTSWTGLLCLGIFTTALLLVILEEFIDLRKSKPMTIAAGLIWALIAWSEGQVGYPYVAETAVRESLLQSAELILLMLVVMTYTSAMTERRVFAALRGWILRRALNYHQMFWLIGATSFLISPLLDNLATTVLMGAVVIAVGRENAKFVALGCVHIVVAANSGGAFSPFGDITTLMVWQQNITTSTGDLWFGAFFSLLLPALAAYLIPAMALSLALPAGRPAAIQAHDPMLRGARRIIALFVATIITAVAFRTMLELPAVIGMLTGLSYLQIFGFYLKRTHPSLSAGEADLEALSLPAPLDSRRPFDIFVRISRIEWDTLLFLYGVGLAVGGLNYLGYLSIASELIYSHWGATAANILVGLFSAVLENVPTMYAVLFMDPQMSQGQWLLVTLTTGIGGSILSIGSAAGIALMGQARGVYTFFTHLRWTPVILLGYAAAVALHLWLNSARF